MLIKAKELPTVVGAADFGNRKCLLLCKGEGEETTSWQGVSVIAPAPRLPKNLVGDEVHIAFDQPELGNWYVGGRAKASPHKIEFFNGEKSEYAPQVLAAAVGQSAHFTRILFQHHDWENPAVVEQYQRCAGNFSYTRTTGKGSKRIELVVDPEGIEVVPEGLGIVISGMESGVLSAEPGYKFFRDLGGLTMLAGVVEMRDGGQYRVLRYEENRLGGTRTLVEKIFAAWMLATDASKEVGGRMDPGIMMDALANPVDSRYFYAGLEFTEFVLPATKRWLQESAAELQVKWEDLAPHMQHGRLILGGGTTALPAVQEVIAGKRWRAAENPSQANARGLLSLAAAS